MSHYTPLLAHPRRGKDNVADLRIWREKFFTSPPTPLLRGEGSSSSFVRRGSFSPLPRPLSCEERGASLVGKGLWG